MRNAVGLDISKTTFDATAIIGGIEKSAKFDNDSKGFEQFKGWLTELGCTDAHICMKATGNYYEGIADYIGSLEAKNKPKKVIIAAIMRKLAVIAYHVHKKGEDYDPTRYKTA